MQLADEGETFDSNGATDEIMRTEKSSAGALSQKHKQTPRMHTQDVYSFSLSLGLRRRVRADTATNNLNKARRDNKINCSEAAELDGRRSSCPPKPENKQLLLHW